VNWPVRAAALMASELAAAFREAVGHEIVLEASTMQKVLESHVRAHLDELAEVRLDLG